MDIKEFEKALLKEKGILEETLASVSIKNPENPNDWQAKYPDLNVDSSDKSDLADEVEEFDNAMGLNAVLEEKLNEIKKALERVQNGSYGMCEAGGEPIDVERLRANPAARTCMSHSQKNSH